MMSTILVIIGYIIGGILCAPIFTKLNFDPEEKIKNSWYDGETKLQLIKKEKKSATKAAVWQSLIWPVCLIVLLFISILAVLGAGFSFLAEQLERFASTSETREIQRKIEYQKAKKIVRQYEQDNQTDWIKKFNEFK